MNQFTKCVYSGWVVFPLAVIKDVASLAGLSVGVVSKYLKDPDSVRQDTRERLEAAIEALNYIPSPQARALRTGRTGMISIISPNITNPFFAELFSIIQARAGEKGYTAILQTIPVIQEEAGSSVISRSLATSSVNRVDGIIVCFPDDEEVLPYLRSQHGHLPLVLLSWSANPQADTNILMDVEDGTYTATKHLMALGHRRIGYVGAPENSTTSRAKQKGFMRAMDEQWLVVRPELVYHGPYVPETGYLAARTFYHSDFQPTAIVTESDIFAIGCIKYCHRKNIRVPEDMAVTGFDDIPMAALYQPSITTVRLPIGEMGVRSVDTLCERLSGKTADAAAPSQFKAELIVRKSTNVDYQEII